MNKKLLYRNADTGIAQYWLTDSEGNVTLQTEQDMTDIVAQNKTLSNMTDKHTRWGDGCKVASIPLSIYYSAEFQRLLEEKKAGNEKPLRAWLNNPDNRFFRTREGKV